MQVVFSLTSTKFLIRFFSLLLFVFDPQIYGIGGDYVEETKSKDFQ